MAPAARQTLRRAPLRLMSENMVIRMEVSIEKDIVFEAIVGSDQEIEGWQRVPLYIQRFQGLPYDALHLPLVREKPNEACQ